jgi:hypothetical protein
MYGPALARQLIGWYSLLWHHSDAKIVHLVMTMMQVHTRGTFLGAF